MDYNVINEKVASLEAQFTDVIGEIVIPKLVKTGFVEDPRLTLNNKKKIQKALELNNKIVGLLTNRGKELQKLLPKE